MNMAKVYFYGCLRDVDGRTEAGHHLYESDGPFYQHQASREVITPFGRFPDGTLCPEGPQYQGIAKLHQKDGWTAIGFWDCTGDSRGNSNSNFIVAGTYTFEEMCKLAAEQYPELWKRIGRVTEAK